MIITDTDSIDKQNNNDTPRREVSKSFVDEVVLSNGKPLRIHKTFTWYEEVDDNDPHARP